MNETADAVAGAPPLAEDAVPACQNCGMPLLGPHCYKCGQPVNGLVRHFSSILGDFADSVLNIDARVFRTLGPLLFKPGYLSREYFAGRRVRYVSPVRLFVFLSIVTFFVAQLVVNFGEDMVTIDGGPRTEEPAAPAGVAGDAPPAAAKADEDDEVNLEFNGRKWDAKTNPVDVAWLPAFADRWINEQIGHGVDNVAELKKNPERFKEAMLGAVPSTLFVLLPIFALMLKLLYLFKRRLYMEHLIVALHSHAFLCLAVLLMVLLAMAEDAVAVSALAVGALDLIEAALWIWMPLYLLLMQKRFYRQGWLMTLLKYCVLGLCYTVLISFGAAFTMLAGLVWA